jgi:hypothetical protein
MTLLFRSPSFRRQVASVENDSFKAPNLGLFLLTDVHQGYGIDAVVLPRKP